MRFVDFLATYALDRREFGDSTKYLYEGVYEVFEGKTIDLTPIDDLVLRIFDPDIIEESGIITEEIQERIDNGELPEVLSESNLLTKIGTFLAGKNNAAYINEINKLRTSDIFRTIPDNYKENWLKTLATEKNSAGMWSKLNKAFGTYQSGNASANFAAKSAEAAKAAAADPTNALASMKAILTKGMSWVLNPAHFNVVLGSVGGILALRLILRILKKRRIKLQQRKMAEAQIAAAMQPKTTSVQTEEIDETSKIFNENMEIIEKLIRTNKQANRVEYGITRQNSPIIDY